MRCCVAGAKAMASQPDWRTVAARAGAVLIAVSGGADSVYLCHHLRAHIPQRSMRFVIAHVNHRTRGAASDGDEDFVRELARQFAWEFHAPRIDADLLTAGANESDLREARLGLLKSLARALRIPTIALGHHANDLAEGFLLAALRGSGPRGLAAMTPVRIVDDDLTFLRPLLTLTRAEIEANLREIGQSWRDDATNAELHAKRNFLRHQVLPLLIQREPNAIHNIAESAQIAAEVDGVYGTSVDALCGRATLAETRREILFSVAPLRTSDAALIPGVIRRLATSVLAGGRHRAIPALPKRENLRDVCARIAITDGDEAVFPLVDDVAVWLSNEYGLVFRLLKDASLKEALVNVRQAFPILLCGEDFPAEDERSGVHVETLPITECRVEESGQRIAWIDEGSIRGKLLMRRVSQEERVVVGEDASKSVGKLLQERRIPRPLRDDVAALCDDDGVLWIPHVARSKRAMISDATRRVLRVSLR